MSPRTYYFAPSPDQDALRSSVSRHFAVGDGQVFIYFDASDVFGAVDRDRNEQLHSSYCASVVRILVRYYEPGAGPLAGWLTVETADLQDFDDQSLALAMAATTGVRFYYRDPTPHPDDTPFAEASQIEVQPSGEQRKVWVDEHGAAGGRTMTDVSDR